MQHVAATYGVAVHHGYHGLGQTAYLHLHVEHIEAWHAIAAHIAPAAFHVHVAPAAEGFVASAGEQHHAYALGLAAPGKGLAHLPRGERGEGVAVARPVDGDLGNAVVFFKQDFLEVEVFNLFPFSFCHNVV